MKFSHVLPLAALSTALVVPPQEVFENVAIEDNHRQSGWYQEVKETENEILSGFKKHFNEVTETSKNAWNKLALSSKSALDQAWETATETAEVAKDKVHETAFDMESWLSSEANSLYESLDDPHHGPPHDGPPHDGPPHDGPGHHPHHPPHHGKPNMTVYQLINESKYTTKLAKLINKFPEIAKGLNSTEHNYTIFAPSDKAFEKIPEHAPEPDEEKLKQILSYHVVDGFYPAGRVLKTHTAPTYLKVDSLASEQKPQRVAFKITLRGLTVNFYSRIVAVDIFGTNGVIHGVDTLLIPPPNVIKVIDLLPTEFSTLELGLGKTGLLETLNTTEHAGGTFFAPSNFAFQKLGPRINAFLFSQVGLKYLKALLEYHVVPDNTLYSDAYYKAGTSEQDVPKGLFHVDLPTMLEDHSLAVDIARYGGFITMKVNAFARVVVQDGIAEDGVIQVVSDVLVPPKKLGGAASEKVEYWSGEDMSVEEFKERLEPYIQQHDL
ncbi:hypothetical protein BAUCODRAFT_35741 [Baudoinia panamericana UAMH 10762]|uniref:FAS1 domain-containing protein n=1 Tax=Baudoinia panamericana (strain UAMH 10762) TaxID=717646 RepID=M2LJY4_BAUPA|nr:uncharacterized protein BAUCODRAFT_35741 [Baudoinia panamericana UAMH 10762]EMC94522.1 hypothetical protein BAUCODRAFT_35741 [Baudoinia panamericana UAMH 10762]